MTQFQRSCAKRLLHGGANTVDILFGYISGIKCFSVLDSRGVLLERISRPIRRYLKEREDTIGELVSGLLGQDSSSIKDLAAELSSPQTRQSAGLAVFQAESNWFPDPLDAPADFSTDNNFDIIGNLLSMYDSKDGIIKELVRRFAATMLLPSDQVSEEIVCIPMSQLLFLLLTFGFLVDENRAFESKIWRTAVT